MHSARFLLLLSTVAPGIVVLLPNWRACFFAMTSPTLLFVFYAWLIPESPLWLLHMGYEDEADAILVEIAEKNGTPISVKTFHSSGKFSLMILSIIKPSENSLSAPSNL